MKKIGAIIWQVLFLINFVITLLLFYPALWFCFRKEKRFPAALRLQRIWAGWLLFSMGIRFKIYGKENIPTSGPLVFAPNHCNFLDIILAYMFVPGYFHFMAKGSLAKVPLFGILFKNTHIPFDRKDPHQSSRAFVKALTDLKKGRNMVLFPEGTQNPNKGTLLPFKEGAFRLAQKSGATVVPVVYKNNLDLLPDQRRLLKWGSPAGPGVARIYILEPILPGNPEEMMELTRDRMLKALKN